MDTADQAEPAIAEAKTARLQEKINALKQQMQQLKELEAQMLAAPDQQISLTDPDARSMNSRGSGIVGYNVQTAVDTQHHLIVAHEVSSVGVDRGQLATMAEQASAATGIEELTVVADRGYFKGEEILQCEQAGITAFVPKPLTSNSRAEGRFGKPDFVYIASDDEYRCPAGQRLIKRFVFPGFGPPERFHLFDLFWVLSRHVGGLGKIRGEVVELPSVLLEIGSRLVHGHRSPSPRGDGAIAEQLEVLDLPGRRCVCRSECRPDRFAGDRDLLLAIDDGTELRSRSFERVGARSIASSNRVRTDRKLRPVIPRGLNEC
jgi:Transposase DDE domain